MNIYKRLAIPAVLASILVFPGVCLAHSSKPAPPDPNNASWGANGVPLVQIFNVTISHAVYGVKGGGVESIDGVNGPNKAIGNLRNVTTSPLQDIVVTVGDHENGDTIVYGTDALKDASLAPTNVWRWSVDPNKGTGYEILGVSVNGQALTKIASPPAAG